MPKGKYWNEELETLPRERLEALQLRSLQEELAFAYARSPYYKRAWDEVNARPEDVKTLADLAKFPFIDKKTQRDTQGVGSFLGELAAVPEEEAVFVSTSSGSTGVPTLSPFTARDFDEFQDVEARLFWQAGIRPNDRYVHALNFALYVGGPDVIGAQRTGALCIWVGAVPSERLLFVLQAYQPTAIWTSPSYIIALGEKALHSGIDPKKDLSVRKIIVAGEMGGSIGATRKAITDIWGAELYDFYGLSDIFGACAGHCEHHDGLHIAEDHIYVETVGLDSGEPLPPGERGELVFTTLRKRARPIIRFRTGDIGRIDVSPCECGRTLGRIYVDGRKDDMFIVSAVNVYPSDIEYVIRAMPEISNEYTIRIFEESYTCKYEVNVENVSDISDDEVREKTVNAMKARIGVRPAIVNVHPHGTLERSTHKAKRVIDQRTETVAKSRGEGI
ncbi:MAG: AMP-binding protein [Oscillospiraceae bacterium]|jgi:phenylacetate-CoA ligase|nr:AMP-binding protein [Oscillospiraceae bacterium]